MALRVAAARSVAAARAAVLRPTIQTRSIFGIFSKDSISANAEQATGDERSEVDAASKGLEYFNRNPLRVAFGTLEKPVMVPSANHSRIVGCTGGVEGTVSNHSALFFEVEEGKATKCPECGQVFVLDHKPEH